MRRLKKTRVAVFGLGAVGSLAVEFLARSGIGALTIVDFDEIRYSNFNRQLLALESSLGKPKVMLAAERIAQIHPHCTVKAYPAFAAEENLAALLKPRPDLVIDAIDSLSPKATLIAYCRRASIPIVSSMGAGGKTDPFSVRCADISHVSVCALARRLKKRLRKLGIRTGVHCVYSVQPALKPKVRAVAEKEAFQRGRDRTPVGSLSYMTGLFGCMVAFEAIRLLLAKTCPIQKHSAMV